MAIEELPLTLESLRTIIGEPSIALDACPICREMPAYCSRFVKGGDVEHDDIPGVAKNIEPFISFGEQVRTTWIGRCPPCHRTYLCVDEYEFIMGGGEDTMSYLRIDAERISRLPEMTRHADTVLRRTGAGWQIEQPKPPPRTAAPTERASSDDGDDERPFAVWDPPTPV